MFKKLLLLFSMLLLTIHCAFAAVEVNTADKAALDAIKDIGPKVSAAIVAERTKAGPFKDWDDLVKRVKGVGPRNSIKMSQAGLTVNGQAKPDAPAKAAAPAKTADKKATDAKPKAEKDSGKEIDKGASKVTPQADAKPDNKADAKMDNKPDAKADPKMIDPKLLDPKKLPATGAGAPK
jgi:competence protein ComEA